MTFGKIYGSIDTPAFITDAGVSVWMWRKGQRVRFLTADGEQVGPEHSNVFPAMLSAFAAGWQDTNLSRIANAICRAEVRAGREGLR